MNSRNFIKVIKKRILKKKFIIHKKNNFIIVKNFTIDIKKNNSLKEFN